MELRPEDFISLARHDLCQNKSNPSHVALRRALSTFYYAMFHTLAETGADLPVGATGASRSIHAWRQTYRGLEHGRVKSACRKAGVMKKFPPSIREFSDFFVESGINRAEEVIKDFNATRKREPSAQTHKPAPMMAGYLCI